MNSQTVSPSRWAWATLLIALGVVVAAPGGAFAAADSTDNGITVGSSVRNDISPPLRDIPAIPLMLQPLHVQCRAAAGSRRNLRSLPDPVVQDFLAPEAMPATDPELRRHRRSRAWPATARRPTPTAKSARPSTSRWSTRASRSSNKTTGASRPRARSTSRPCGAASAACARPTASATRSCSTTRSPTAGWSASSPAHPSPPTSAWPSRRRATPPAAWHRYDFHLGTNFFDYPKLGVWPDAYYLSMNVFNACGHGLPRPAAVRARPRGHAHRRRRPPSSPPACSRPRSARCSAGDLDGANPPPAGAPNPWLSTKLPTWQLYRFHVDWAVPANSTFTLGRQPDARPATRRSRRTCRSSAPPALLDNLADRPMFRLAYRRFADGHEALVGNLTVSSGGVAGVRWWEINNATSGTPSLRPAGHLPARHDLALDGQRRHGLRGQPRRRLQRLERQHQPADPLRRTAGGRPGEHAGAGRGHALRRAPAARSAPAAAGATTAT